MIFQKRLKSRCLQLIKKKNITIFLQYPTLIFPPNRKRKDKKEKIHGSNTSFINFNEPPPSTPPPAIRSY